MSTLRVRIRELVVLLPDLGRGRAAAWASVGLALAYAVMSPNARANELVSESSILQHVAETHGFGSAELELADRQVRELEMTGKIFTRAKVIHPREGLIFTVELDSAGAPVDGRRLLADEEAAYRTRFGALHPTLRTTLESVGETESIEVGFWLRAAQVEFPLRRDFMDPARPTREGARAFRQAFNEIVPAQIAELRAPLLADLATRGYEATYASSIAPLVYAKLPPAVIRELARRLDVDTVYGPSEARDVLDVAKPTVKADVVDSWNFEGNGITVAILEDSRVNFSNPELAAGVTRVPGDPNVDDHATQTAGIVASLDSVHGGLAQGVQIYSANATDYTASNIAAAIDWCVAADVDIINNSWGGNHTTTFLNDHDRHLDWVSRNAADTVTVAAGNEAGSCGAMNGYVGSPGRGYNVITVGGFNDQGTLTWDDDAMYACSSTVDPASGAEKPEVVAPSVDITSTTASTPWFGTGSGTSFAAPMVAAVIAQMLTADSGLAAFPETCKAIVMATALHNIEGASRLSEQDGAGGVDARAAVVASELSVWHNISAVPSTFPIQYSYYCQQGKRIRAAVSWNSDPNSTYTSDPLTVDLDLLVTGPNGANVTQSTSLTNAFEIVEFVPTESGIYRFEIVENLFPSSGSEYAGFAIWGGGDLELEEDVPVSLGGSCNPPDHLAFTPATGWNVVAVQPEVGLNYNLALFEGSPWQDPEDHVALLQSTLSGDLMDFVVLDRNHLSQGRRFLEVREQAGVGDRTIEHAESRAEITVGEFGPYSFGPLGLVEVFDLSLNAGLRKYVRTVVVSGTADVALFLFDSDPAIADTWVQKRSDNLMVMNVGAAGEEERFDFLAPASDRYGLVIANLSPPLGASFKVLADVTPPSGTVSINGGLAQTGSYRVRVGITAEDTDTGIHRIRARESGGTWLEVFSLPVGPLSLARQFELDVTPGPGTRTVEVEIQNNAGMVTQVTDSIDLYACPQPAGALANGNFSDTSGFPWCFNDTSATGFVAYAGAEAAVRGGDDPVVGLTATFISQRFILVDTGIHELGFSWRFESVETAAGTDAAAWDLLDAATGNSVIGGVALLSTMPGDFGTVTQNVIGPGTFELRLGTLSNGGQTGAGTSSFDLVQVVPTLVEAPFERSDCNSDGGVNITDVVFGLEALFGSGTPTCRDACDANDDGAFNIVDAVYTANYLFSGGLQPPAPFGVCGMDPTPDPLHCVASAACP